jgi:uncharacterized protein YkwD
VSIRTATAISQVIAVVVFAVSFMVLTSMDAHAEIGLDDTEQQILVLINEERARNGLGPLVATQTLDAAADWMAQDIATMAQLSHTDTLGRSLRDRLNAFDYPSNSAIRENIAAGYSGADTVVQAWIDSPGHHANILATDIQAIGIALYQDPGSNYVNFWVTDFGSIIDTPPPVAPTSGEQTAAELPTPSTEPVVQIGGSVPSLGVGLLLAQQDGTPQQLVATVQASGCVNASLWISQAGQLVGYIDGAPAFVNGDFPTSVAAGTVFIVSCS